MAFDQPTRNRLARFVGEARRLIAEEFTGQFQSLYGISTTGHLTPVEQLGHLDETQRAAAAVLRDRIHYLVNSHPGDAKPDAAAVDRLAREHAFTVLNRLAAIRMAEKRGLIVESVGKGYQSKGFQVYSQVAGSGLGETFHRYRRYLFCLFDELAVDLGVLFDRRSASAILFPREQALLDLLALLNAPDLDALWAEDETIGWIYQYYNDTEERKKMREASAAPRNCRELAVRNQFFTPRYVVEFLTDNTLGRLWYEMTRGRTRLADRCKFMVRRPFEIFLPAPDTNFWHDAPGQEELRKFSTTADPTDLPEAPALGVLYGWLAHLPPVPTPYFDGIHDDSLCGLGFPAALRTLGTTHEALIEKWAPFLFGGDTSSADPEQAHTMELLDLLWRLGVQAGRDGNLSIDAVSTHPPTDILWRVLRTRLQHPPEGLSQEDLLRQPQFIVHRPLKGPREIRLLDPACGSMHFGLYAFDLYEIIYEEAWELGLLGPGEFGQRNEPVIIVESARLNLQATPVSNYSSNAVPFQEAWVVVTKQGDFGDGVRADYPYIVPSEHKFRVPFDLRLPLRDFDLFRAMRAGWFDERAASEFIRETDAFHVDVLPPVSSDEAHQRFLHEVPRLIVEHNIHGIDIDPRAVQIAGLSLWLRAQRAWHEAGVKPVDRPRILRSNLVCAEPMPGDKELLRDFVEEQFPAGERSAFAFLLEKVFDRMTLAGEAGSLLRIEEEIRSAIAEARALAEKQSSPRQASLFPGEERPEQAEFNLRGLTDEQFWHAAEQRIYDALEAYAEQAENGGGFQRRLFADDAARGFAFIDLCRKRYDVALMNPPFGLLATPTKDYLFRIYPTAKEEIMNAMILASVGRLNRYGTLGCIGNRTVFFLANHEEWRRELFERKGALLSFGDLGHGVLDGALVETAAFVLRAGADLTQDSTFITALSATNKQLALEETLPRVKSPTAQLGGLFVRRLKELTAVPGFRLAYAVPREFLHLFENVASLDPKYGQVIVGLQTSDNERFLRLAWEIDVSAIGQMHEALESNPCLGWAYFAKGGEYSPYFADIHLVCEWRGDGAVMKAFASALYGHWSHNIHHPEFYFRPGLTFSRRTASSFNPRALPAGCLFGEQGPTIFPMKPFEQSPLAMLAICHSRVFQAFVELMVASGDTAFSGSAARTYERGVIGRVPLVYPSEELLARLSEEARKVTDSQRLLDAANETSRFFSFPAFILDRSEFAPRLAKLCAYSEARAIDAHLRCLDATASIERLVFEIYNFHNATRSWINSEVGPHPNEFAAPQETSVAPAEFRSIAETDDAKLIDGLVASRGGSRFLTKKAYFSDRRIELLCFHFRLPPREIVRLCKETGTLLFTSPSELPCTLISYVTGIAFGRWDIRYATGVQPTPELPDPFAPLPVCPPGMLQGEDGLPLSPEAGRRLRAEGRYPLDVAWGGILVDDPEHPLDLERHFRAALGVLWGERADVLEHEACTLLGVPTLREWFRRPAGFFADHLKRYSKSRRQAPIYWPISTASGSYTLWLYYHRLTDQTLHTAIADFLDPKIKALDRDIASLREAPGGGTGSRLGELLDFQDELNALRAELEGVIKLPWRPNLNDGVLITASPLWKLFRLGKWQKDLKACWEALEKGYYDWAHLAYTIWPERVREKCRTDRSVAIAHGLEELCEVAAPAAKSPRRSKSDPAAKERQAKREALQEELTEALAYLLLDEKIPLNVVNGQTGEIVIPANRKITKTLLRKMASLYDRIEIDPSPVQRKVREIIAPFERRFAELDGTGSGASEDPPLFR